MNDLIQPGLLGISLVLIVLAYTIYLVRAEKLSAHMAMSWIIAECACLIVMSSGFLRSSIKTFLGEQNAPYSLFLLGTLWIVFLMLESLTRVSSLTMKLKLINQELALTKEQLARVEALINQGDHEVISTSK